MENRLKREDFRAELVAQKYKLLITERPQLKLVFKK